jgi:hypothetical protein
MWTTNNYLLNNSVQRLKPEQVETPIRIDGTR